MKSLTSIFAAIVLASAAPSWQGRQVVDNAVVSPPDPRVRIALPAPARYVGRERWVLFGIADCELYAFVEADARKRIQKLFWVQFESYVPMMPALQHEYTSKRHATLGGLDFLVDTWNEDGVHPPDLKALTAAIRAKGYRVPDAIRSGSDEEHLYVLLRSHRYAIPEKIVSVRLVHLVDPRKRKELMIIYTEPAPATQSGVIRRAKEQLSITTLR